MAYFDVPLQVTPALIAALSANIQAMSNLLGSLPLTEEEVKSLVKMGPRRYAFSVEAFQFATVHSHVLVHNRNLTSFTHNKTGYELLGSVFKELDKVYAALYLYFKVLGSNTYVHALSAYRTFGQENNDAEPGIENARKSLALFFKGQGTHDVPEEDQGQTFIPEPNSNTGGPNPGN